MKKWTVSLVICSLVLVGTFVVYQQATSAPQLCEYFENWCDGCNGTFTYDSCWWYNGLQWCLVTCQNCDYICNCDTWLCVI